MLTQEKLKQVLRYNPYTGDLRWLNTGSGKVGIIPGTTTKEGYIRIGFMGQRFLAHRLIWLYVNGYFPEHHVDHKDGDRQNNSYDNLRHSTNACNLQNTKLSKNNTSGFNGVTQDRRNGIWIASICINYVKTIIGYYPTRIKAALARARYEDDCPEWTCDYQEVNRKKLRRLGYSI